MQKFILTLCFLLVSAITFSQSLDKMSYQAVIRDGDGALVSNHSVGIQISILQYTEAGSSVFTETHLPTTNKNGLVSLNIGAGTLVSGVINTIDWSSGPYFLKVETDPTGGNTYSITNTSQILSVPYALYSKSSGSSISGWNLSGNSVSAIDFIGTNNNQPLQFKVDRVRSGYISADDANVFWGYESGASNTLGFNNVANGYQSFYSNQEGGNNVANGYQSLYANTTGNYNVANGANSLFSNTIGNYNSANGFQSLYNNTEGTDNVANGYQSLQSNKYGNYNVANGSQSLNSNRTGHNNIANGYQSLYSNTSGGDNVANGHQSLYTNTTGNNNVANGWKSLYSNTTADGNVANGYKSLFSNTTGYVNVATGNSSLSYNTTGYWNTANGHVSLSSNITGFCNTAIGAFSDVSTTNLFNATAIGFGAIVNSSNKVRIGNLNVTAIEGQVPFSYPSDARFKYNIKNNVPGLDFIKKLQPVTYYFDENKLEEFTKTGVINTTSIYPVSYKGEKEIHTGFLAQDVEKIALELGYHFDGVRVPQNNKDHYSLAYSQFIMPLVKGMQEQQTVIEQLQETNKQLQDAIKKLEEKMEKLIGK